MNERFVDRVDEADRLRKFARAVPGGTTDPCIVVEGPSGMGKSALLADFEAAQSELPVDVYTVRCNPTIGPTLTFGPIVDLLALLESRRRSRRLLRKPVVAGVTASVPALLGELVPGLKPVVNAGAEVVKTSLGSGSMPFDSLMPFQQAAAIRITEAIGKRIAKRPSVFVIDDVHRCDHSSLEVLDRLMRRPEGLPMGLVLGFDPFHSGGRETEPLLGSWEREGLLRRLPIGGLPAEAVADLVESKRPVSPPEFAAELSQVTGGHPIFVVKCLDDWENAADRGIALPESLAHWVDEQLEALPESSRELVVLGAAQGYGFDSATLAGLAGREHAPVRDRLHELARRSHLIEADGAPPWARYRRADHYRFQHRALWRLVYRSQSIDQRRERHERIAAAELDRLGETANLEHRLEIARHYRAAGVRCLGASSDFHLELASRAATELLSMSEAEWLCGIAIDAARSMPPGEPGRDARLIRAIVLHLSLTEVRWKGLRRPTGERDVDALAAEAEEAARRHGDPVLLARAAMMRGKTLMSTRGLEVGLERLHRAVELAESSGDAVALYVARIEYGRQVSKRRLADGLAQLAEAERMRRTDARISGGDDPVLNHSRNLGEIQYGITLFDSGRLGEALDRLVPAVDRMRAEGSLAELPIALNYLAQVRTTLGDLEGAEDALREACSIEEERGGESGWHAYNSALLAHPRGRSGAAGREVIALMESAWEETERTWLLNLVPIVRNLYAQALLEHRGDLEMAGRLAQATVEETRQSGMVRSTIAAHMLLGRIARARGDAERALREAEHGVRILDEVGPMPALRTEEVCFHAALAHAAAGRSDSARELLDRARAELDRKAELIDDPAVRTGFVERDPLNRAIRDGEGSER
ncbi:ATP-binding protein [Glycomyces xiaoerkulensis]|uniref:ATP-binding protein n=1 Tax=Glycomyces xiaoerkulensis TaxID=2038139 RepID=UPI000C25A68E|nr:AAA family ATPase [Glycomyces xiaoerkulensis]